MSGLKKERAKLTQERVKELFSYNPIDGSIIRALPVRCPGGLVGNKPGTVMKGNYTRVVVDKQKIFKHLLVWLWNYGYIPDAPVRHINGDHTDDRLENLTLEYIKYEGELTQLRVKELIDYDPLTGIVTRKIKTINSLGVGESYKAPNGKGYLTIKIDGTVYPLHRIIWLWYYGYMPENQIDHISRDKLDNSISNLREVSNSCNTRNTRVYSTNKTGVKGVAQYKHYSTYIVRIHINGDSVTVCRTKDFTEAVCHRYAAEQCLNWLDCDTTSSAYLYLKEQGIVK